MSTITREQAQKIIEAADEIITALAGTNEDVHPESDNMLRLWDDLNDRYAPPEVVRELARIALASFEAEPVAWLLSGGGAKNNVSFDSGNAYADPLREVTPLYTAPPAPVSVPAAMEMDDDFDSAFEHGKAVGWNAYRAAMLQGAGGNYPDGWVACSERMPKKNDKVLIFIDFNSENVPPSIHDAEFTGATFRRGGATVNVYPLEDGYGVTHWKPLPSPPAK